MSDLRGPILTVVANPKTFLWAPFELAIINILMAVAFMIACVTVLGINQFLAMIPLVGGHASLVIFGTKDQHLTSLVQAYAQFPRKRKNLVPVKVGTKFVP